MAEGRWSVKQCLGYQFEVNLPCSVMLEMHVLKQFKKFLLWGSKHLSLSWQSFGYKSGNFSIYPWFWALALPPSEGIKLIKNLIRGLFAKLHRFYIAKRCEWLRTKHSAKGKLGPSSLDLLLQMRALHVKWYLRLILPSVGCGLWSWSIMSVRLHLTLLLVGKTHRDGWH